MRAYTKTEQKRILHSAFARHRKSDLTKLVENDQEAVMEKKPAFAEGETPEVIQLLVDLESETKFRSLMRMIQRRLRWI